MPMTDDEPVWPEVSAELEVSMKIQGESAAAASDPRRVIVAESAAVFSPGADAWPDSGKISCVEIVGPAGSGKSTLSRLLLAGGPGFLPGRRLQLQQYTGAAFFFAQALTLAPLLLRWQGGERRPSVEELKKLAYLNGWHRVLRRQALATGRPLLIDQGPIFNLATLYAYGPEQFRGRRFAAWRGRAGRRWGTLLDTVVLLDAPDEVLYERIRARDKRHPVKQSSFCQAQRFLACYRRWYETITTQFVADCGVRLYRYDTRALAAERLAERILADLHPHDGGR